jgi:GMP synthase PP-ATPase subunit
MRHLKNIEDPEQKRKIIGRTFIDVFDAEAIKLKEVKFLAQGLFIQMLLSPQAQNQMKLEL